MGGTVSSSVGNRYGKKIWVKYDVEKKYVQMEDYTVEGQVGFSEISAGVGVSVSRKYDWNKIQMDFTPIKSGDFKELTIDCKDSKVVYITIVAEDGEIICKTWPMNVANSIVITEEGGLRMAEESNPLKAHRKYDKLGTGSSVVSNSATHRKQKSEENTSYSARKAKRELTSERATRTVSSPAKSATKSSDTAVTTKKTTTPTTSGGDKKAYAKAEVRHTIALKRAGERTADTGGLRHDLSQIRAEKSGSVTAKDIGDKHECNINGMDVTYNGTIIVVDYKNKKLKYFSPDNTVLSVLSLPARPTALTVVNATTAVAPAANNKLYIIRISDQSVLSLKGEMQLQYYILAITNYKGYLVATCMTDPRCVKMIDSQGNEMWSVSRDELGRDLFSWPCGIITTTFNTAVVVVSSFGNDTLTLLEATNGKLIRTIDLEGKMPSGITLDNNGNAYNCHWQTDEIFVWSNEFNENRILLSKDQLEKSPRFIVYCGMNNCLYVAYDDNNKIDVFSYYKKLNQWQRQVVDTLRIISR